MHQFVVIFLFFFIRVIARNTFFSFTIGEKRYFNTLCAVWFNVFSLLKLDLYLQLIVQIFPHFAANDCVQLQPAVQSPKRRDLNNSRSI